MSVENFDPPYIKRYLLVFWPLVVVAVSIVELLEVKTEDVVVTIGDESMQFVGEFCSILMRAGNEVVGVLGPKLLFEVVTSDTWHGSRFICNRDAAEIVEFLHKIVALSLLLCDHELSGTVRLQPVCSFVVVVIVVVKIDSDLLFFKLFWCCWCKFNMQSLIVLLLFKFPFLLAFEFDFSEPDELDEDEWLALPKLWCSPLIESGVWLDGDDVEKLTNGGGCGTLIRNGSVNEPWSHRPSSFLVNCVGANEVVVLLKMSVCDCTNILPFGCRRKKGTMKNYFLIFIHDFFSFVLFIIFFNEERDSEVLQEIIKKNK